MMVVEFLVSSCRLQFSGLLFAESFFRISEDVAMHEQWEGGVVSGFGWRLRLKK